MPLSVAEREEFLAQPHIAALSVAADAGRGPLMAPVWYNYSPGGSVWIVMHPDSRKAKLIIETGRFSLLVHRLAPTTRYVAVEGRVTGMRQSTAEERRAMASRYLTPEKVEPYVEFAHEEFRVDLQPEHWLSSDLGEP